MDKGPRRFRGVSTGPYEDLPPRSPTPEKQGCPERHPCTPGFTERPEWALPSKDNSAQVRVGKKVNEKVLHSGEKKESKAKKGGHCIQDCDSSLGKGWAPKAIKGGFRAPKKKLGAPTLEESLNKIKAKNKTNQKSPNTQLPP